MSRRERLKRRTRHRPHPAKRILLLTTGLGLSAIVIGVLAAVGWVVAVAESAPNISDSHPRMPHPPTEIFAGDGTPLGYVHADVISTPLTSAQIPQMMRNATVAVEDRRFFQHGALDYQGILRAGVKDVFGGGGGGIQGASTLTMQLVDNEYVPPNLRAERNLKYKIVQAKLAEQLESKHSKNWILNAYLNDAPYGTVAGETARGVGAASEMFFDKPVTQLDLAQMALLAGLPQAPSEYNPFIDRAAALQRRAHVLQTMVVSHYITAAQATAAERSPLQVKNGNAYSAPPRYPFVFNYVVQQLEARYGASEVQNGGLKVYTTLQPHDEDIAQAAVDDHEGGSGNPAAALSSVNPNNGHILALAATESPSQTHFFYATQALRQPGSAFKVFALMTLIHDYEGDPNQTYYNSHLLNAGWDPGNPTWSVHTAEKSYMGDINLTEATIVSDNTVYAQLVLDLGMPKFEAMARAMGIPANQLNGNPSEVIGGLHDGVTTLQMAEAYATIANGGTYRPSTIIARVVFPDGHTDNLGQPQGHRVFSDGDAAAAINVLKQVITNPGGTGTAAEYGCPAAGKTGTAENYANAWFVGFTPKLSTAVWVGFPQGNDPMVNGYGGTLAAPIWRQYMQAASNGYCGDWPPPSHPASLSQFTGPHSTGGPLQNAGGNSNTTGTTTTPTPGYGYGVPGTGNTGYGATGGTPPANGANPYNNPYLYAQPGGAPAPTAPQPPNGTGQGATTGGTTQGSPGGPGGQGGQG